MVLQAFFDESGTHAGARATNIAGFIGKPAEWDRVEDLWRGWLDYKNIPEFHYHEFENREGVWEAMEREVRDPIRAGLAKILADSDLVPVNAGYRGRWEPESFVGVSPDRYPSAYSFCFEMTMEMAIKCSDEEFDSEPILVVFARHQEYSSRVQEFFDLFRHNRLWDRFISPIAFDSPFGRAALQCADMIAYECYQCLKDGSSGYYRWPLLTMMWDGKPHGVRQSKYIGFHDEQTLPEVFKRPTHRLHRPA